MFCRSFQQSPFVWLAFAVVAAWFAAAAETPNASPQQLYRVRRWTTEQGLPQNRISSLQQTRDGYLWIGTWAGLARFDGVRFTVFDKYNTPELVDDAINALAEDSDGTLWIGTADGLLSYRGHQFHRLTTADGLPASKVWRLSASRSGGVWVQAGGFVSRLERGQFSGVRKLQLPAWAAVHSLREGSDAWLHIVTGSAWLMLSPKAGDLRTNFVAATSGFEQLLAGLPEDRAGSFWAGTRGGLRRWEHGIWKAAGPHELGAPAVDFIYQDHSSNVWVNAKPGGLYRWDHARWSPVDLEDRIAAAAVICMEEDYEGNFWVGTDHGLVQLQERRVRTFTTRDGLAHDEAWSVCEGLDGTIWVGTRWGLSRIQGDRVVPLESEEPYPAHVDRSVWPSRDGGVWIGKAGLGLLEFRDEFITRLDAEDLPRPTIAALYEDRAGRLWVGTGHGVIVFKDGKVIARYTRESGQPLTNVKCILEDRDGIFWFGTQGQGLIRLRDGGFDVLTERDGLSSDRVWALHEDAEGALWIGTENGLTRRKAGKLFAFTTKHGLVENAVNCILEDSFGYFWLSGLRGIYRLNREPLNGVGDGRAEYVNVASFGSADGMESSETNGENQPAGWKARDGRLWFPTTCGVVMIDPKTIPTNELPPAVVIEQVRADEQIIFGDGSSSNLVAANARRFTSKSDVRSPKSAIDQRLLASAATARLGPSRARVLEIHYTANSMTAPERVRFKYKLDPNDGGWHEAGAQRVAFFTNLRPGSYAFRVKACNHHGSWNEAGASFAFSVAPHFYETWPFYALCGVAILGLAGGVQRYRLSIQRRILRLQQQRAIEQERCRIARDLHDELGSRLTALAVRTELAGQNSNGPDGENFRALTDESRALAERMRDVIWTVDPECDSLEALAARLIEHAEEFLGTAGIRLRLELPEILPALPLSADARHQLTMVAKEALHNVLKHAHASEVRLGVELHDAELRLRVIDNGVGLSESGNGGRGLGNMRTRINALGGVLQIHSQPGQGTTVDANVPLKNLDQIPQGK